MERGVIDLEKLGALNLAGRSAKDEQTIKGKERGAGGGSTAAGPRKKGGPGTRSGMMKEGQSSPRPTRKIEVVGLDPDFDRSGPFTTPEDNHGLSSGLVATSTSSTRRSGTKKKKEEAGRRRKEEGGRQTKEQDSRPLIESEGKASFPKLPSSTSVSESPKTGARQSEPLNWQQSLLLSSPKLGPKAVPADTSTAIPTLASQVGPAKPQLNWQQALMSNTNSRTPAIPAVDAKNGLPRRPEAVQQTHLETLHKVDRRRAVTPTGGDSTDDELRKAHGRNARNKAQQVPGVKAQANQAPLQAPIASHHLLPAEIYAGGAFQNSPAPGSLPKPNFLGQVKPDLDNTKSIGEVPRRDLPEVQRGTTEPKDGVFAMDEDQRHPKSTVSASSASTMPNSQYNLPPGNETGSAAPPSHRPNTRAQTAKNLLDGILYPGGPYMPPIQYMNAAPPPPSFFFGQPFPMSNAPGPDNHMIAPAPFVGTQAQAMPLPFPDSMQPYHYQAMASRPPDQAQQPFRR